MTAAAVAVASALAGPFYADPDSNAGRQAHEYEEQGRPEAARVMRSLAAVPQAFWFTGGTPKQVRKQVNHVAHEAAAATRPAGRSTTAAGSTGSSTASRTAARW